MHYICNVFFVGFVRKQEAHGQHRSPVQNFCIFSKSFYKLAIISFQNALSHDQVWLKLTVYDSGNENFFSQCNFTILLLSTLEKGYVLNWTNFNTLQPRMLCSRFGWNWPTGSGEEDILGHMSHSGDLLLWVVVCRPLASSSQELLGQS